jgi:hypothetical protein
MTAIIEHRQLQVLFCNVSNARKVEVAEFTWTMSGLSM